MMKRPDINDYLIIPNIMASVKRGYYMDIEKYCDDLEARYEDQIRELGELYYKSNELYFALQRACKELQSLTDTDSNEWEEYCMYLANKDMKETEIKNESI